jgi:serine/threonine protein kinase/formylglycine-generating enzyme required for sulfatase activity
MDQIPEAARSAFAEFLVRRGRGEDVDLDALCAGRPDIAVGLRLLHSLHEHGDSTIQRSASEILRGEDLLSPLLGGGIDRLVPGASVGPYRIVESIGSGGMGAVFLAEQERPVRRRVALKVIKLGMDTREVVARFEAERQALALMDHPSIATVLDAGATEEGRPYFVMEYVRGVPLTAYCDQHELGMERRLALFVQVAEGVQHAHQKGIIHRDLKPSNVLVSDRAGAPAPKIIDFGVAKAVNQRLTESTLCTEVGQIIGTPEYMSPEQAETRDLDIDTRTDIYSLGVLLYELATGTLPFDSKRLRQGGYAAIQRIIREEEPPKPSTRLSRRGSEAADLARKRNTDPRALVRQIRGDLDWIIMKAMAKDRARRYASASELAADIRRHMRHEPVLAGPPGAAYRVKKFVRRQRVKLALAASVTLLLAAMSAATWRITQAGHHDRQLRIGEGHLRQGQALAREYRQLRDGLSALERRWKEAAAKQPLWEPVWERQDEIAAWKEYERQQREVEARFLEAVPAMNKAWETAPPGSTVKDEARLALEALYMERFREGERQGEIRLTSEHFKALVQSLGVGTYREELEGAGIVALESVPPGADVYCFRYEEHEQRLVPVAFAPVRGKEDPAAGLVGKPFLEVEKVWDSSRSPFQPGDRLLSLRGEEVSLQGDVARVLEGVGAGASVPARVRRGGEVKDLVWIPFPEKAPAGGDLSFRESCGLAFAGYPLDLVDGCRVGRTGASPLQAALPRGSYLFVFRLEGRRDARLPVAVPWQRERVQARLLKESEIPPGFVLIPGGTFPCGGDSRAFQSLEAGEQHLDDFFIGRFEVTAGEYLEFVNDPEVLAGTDDQGEALPSTMEARRELEEVEDEDRVWLIPKFAGKPRWERSPRGGWSLPESSSWRIDWPMLDVTHLAALEYAAWRTRKEKGPWRYRLPTDLEWEKAARGADRRVHVWGNYMVWSFCWSLDRPGKTPAVVGVSPLDESVFGVRDLAGSVQEHTSGKPLERFRYRSLRGGGWNSVDEFYYRAATRNSLYPERSHTQTGFRLVAEADSGARAEGATGRP